LRKKKKEKSHGKADALPWLFDEVLREKGFAALRRDKHFPR